MRVFINTESLIVRATHFNNWASMYGARVDQWKKS